MLLIRVGLYLFGIGAVALGAAVLRWPAADRSPSGISVHNDDWGSAINLTADSIAVVQERDPFRRERTPAQAAYDPVQKAEAEAPAPPPVPKPILAVSGILWGGEPTVVLDGIPGVEGPRLMRTGDSLGGLRVKRIRKDGVEIRGYDTTWVLEVRRAW